jgi:AraC-like DNA-binding protein
LGIETTNMIAAHHIEQVHYPPASELIPYVSSYCHYKLESHLQKDTLFFLPEGIVEIIFQHGAHTHYTHPISKEWLSREQAFVGGLHTRAYQMKISEPGFAFSIRFRAGAFAHFVKLPVHELKNQLLSPGLIWGKAGQEWQDKLALTKSIDQKIELTDQFLQSQFSTCSPFPTAVLQNFIHQKNGHCKVSDLAKIAYLSPAQFRHRFNSHFGVPPKTYLQLYRLGRVKHLQATTTNLRDLAFQLGYYDPSHFHKEVQLITGLLPKSFCQQQG